MADFVLEVMFNLLIAVNCLFFLNDCLKEVFKLGRESCLSKLTELAASLLMNNSMNFRREITPSWNNRRRNLVRSNSISDLSESLSSERKRSFSSLDEEDEYTSDASSIRRSPSSLRKLNARRKGKEKLTCQKNKTIKERKNSVSSTTSTLLDKGKNKAIEEDDIMSVKDHSEDQDRMSISTESTYYKTKEEMSSIKEKEELKNDLSPYADETLTNLEFNEIQQQQQQQKGKHENKENIRLICNCTTTTNGQEDKLPESSIVPREMIFVDEMGNVYNEQNYKYLSNYTKAVIADELSKRYCRIPLTEILVSNMPEYRQYFDENGQLKPNNFIYVDNDDEEEEDHQDNRKEKKDIMEGSSRSTTPINNDIHVQEEGNTNNDDKNQKFGSISRCSSPISNINLINKDTNATIEFRTEPLNADKEMIFESTLSPKGKREWQDITKTSLHSTDDGLMMPTDEEEFETEKDGRKESFHHDEDSTIKKEKTTTNNKRKEVEMEKEEDEEEDNFVEKIDDKITIIYRTNESKYQLVIPIKLNIYNKKDTLL